MATKKKENVKLSEEELAQLRNLEERNSYLRNEIVRAGITRLNLEQLEDTIETIYKENLQIETQLAKSLEEKYGQGRVDIPTGEFIPA